MKYMFTLTALAMLVPVAAATAQSAPPPVTAPVAPPPQEPAPAESVLSDRVNAAFDANDTGAKGYLTNDEFAAMMADVDAEERSENGAAPSDPGEVRQKAQMVFDSADKDADGQVTKDELIAYVIDRRSARKAPSEPVNEPKENGG